MRVRIIGGIGSGKTYLAKKLADDYRLPHARLDDVYWDNTTTYGTKRKPREREALLKKLLKKPSWVIEGVYYDAWAQETIIQADHFIYLDVPAWKRRMRVIKRFLLAKVGRATAHEHSFKDVRKLFGLDAVWIEGMQPVIKKARTFTSADQAAAYLARQHDAQRPNHH